MIKGDAGGFEKHFTQTNPMPDQKYIPYNRSNKKRASENRKKSDSSREDTVGKSIEKKTNMIHSTASKNDLILHLGLLLFQAIARYRGGWIQSYKQRRLRYPEIELSQ